MLLSQTEEERSTNVLFRRLVFGVIFLLLIYSIVLGRFLWPSKVSLADAGNFGSSFGALAALFSGLAFAGLIWTVLLQRIELQLQRKELLEARKQAVLTRVMTVTQNQVAAFRTEISFLQFRHINDPNELIGVHQMMYIMTSYMDEVAKTRPLDVSSAFQNLSDISEYLKVIFASINSYQALIEGVKRCCKANRYLVIDELIGYEEAQDVKALLFSELPSNLMSFIFQLHLALEIQSTIRQKSGEESYGLFDPVSRLKSDCELILNHQSIKFTDESLAYDKKEKWLFAE